MSRRKRFLACLCHPLAYRRWYRFNQGRITAAFPALLTGVTIGILGLIYLDFPIMFQTPTALPLLWLLGSFLALLFVITRPGSRARRSAATDSAGRW